MNSNCLCFWRYCDRDGWRWEDDLKWRRRKMKDEDSRWYQTWDDQIMSRVSWPVVNNKTRRLWSKRWLLMNCVHVRWISIQVKLIEWVELKGLVLMMVLHPWQYLSIKIKKILCGICQELLSNEAHETVANFIDLVFYSLPLSTHYVRIRHFSK